MKAPAAPPATRPVPAAADEIRVVLFDVGGVLVELGGVEAMLQWLGHRLTAEQLWQRWLRSPSVRAFETGRSDAMQFAIGLLEELQLTLDPQHFLNSFIGWPSGLYPGALELANRIPPQYRRALLSNSNSLHWPRVLDGMGLRCAFEHHYASHLIGKIKPDAEAFEHVLQSLGCRAGEVLFLDDNVLNVEAARQLGMRAEQVRGVLEAQHTLQQAGIIAASG